MRKYRSASALVTLVLLATAALTACGESSSKGSNATRVIDVAMTDLAFAPATFEVTKGETVTFRFRNNGQAVHEAVVGDEAYQMAHASAMGGSSSVSGGHSMGDMGHGSMGGEGMVTVKPGKTAEMTRSFDEAGTLLIGCHQPGHYEAGMKATITVA
jgi:uncharacterized cupredoxin-like copper-binding protein